MVWVPSQLLFVATLFVRITRTSSKSIYGFSSTRAVYLSLSKSSIALAASGSPDCSFFSNSGIFSLNASACVRNVRPFLYSRDLFFRICFIERIKASGLEISRSVFWSCLAVFLGAAFSATETFSLSLLEEQTAARSRGLPPGDLTIAFRSCSRSRPK